jgi:hypothetical protein
MWLGPRRLAFPAGKRANPLPVWRPHEQALSGMASLQAFLHAARESAMPEKSVFIGFQTCDCAR